MRTSRTSRPSVSRFWFALLGAVLGSCGAADGPVLANLGFEVRCDGTTAADGGTASSASACEWHLVEGTLRYGGTWNAADVGLDLTGSARVSVEQRTRFQPPSKRDYVLNATVLREEASLRFELHWYRALPASVTDYWGAAPALLRIDRLTVDAAGLSRYRGLVALPSEAGGLVLRIVREGDGRAWVDELLLRSL